MSIIDPGASSKPRVSAMIDDKPSYSKLKANIGYLHPRNNSKEGSFKFGICDNLGRYPCPCPCQKTTITSEDITQMGKEIGVGPALFLMTTKTLIWFFILMTILNLPVYLFLFNSNQTADCSRENP